MRLATRASRLARIQAELAGAALQKAAPGLDVSFVEARSSGDINRSVPLAALGGKGAFTREIEQAVLDGRADVAVHSLKDLPVDETPGLVLAAVLPRASPWDVLISKRDFETTPSPRRIGASSARRAAEWLRLHPEDEIVPVRGNVPTRLGKLDAGEFDALILAEAGLQRLEVSREFRRFGADEMLPAVGQGTIALQCRTDDEQTLALLQQINDTDTMGCALIERAVIRRLGAECGAAVGVLAEVAGDGVRVRSRLLSPDGRNWCEAWAAGQSDDPEELGREIAETLLRQGAGELLREAHAAVHAAPASVSTTVVVTRDEGGDGELAQALAREGIDSFALPVVRHEAIAASEWAADLEPLGSFDWLVFTSVRGVSSFVASGLAATDAPPVACAGAATAHAARDAGLKVALCSKGKGVAGLAEELRPKLRDGGSVLYLSAEEPARDFETLLARTDVRVVRRAVYRTRTPAPDKTALAELRGRPSVLVLFCSPSAVHGMAAMLGGGVLPPGWSCGVIGPTTREAAAETGFLVAFEPGESSFATLARAAASWLRNRSSRHTAKPD